MGILLMVIQCAGLSLWVVRRIGGVGDRKMVCFLRGVSNY